MVSAAPSPIAPDPLQAFVEQLSHWAESLISRGRSPLRKVETFASLLTAGGEMRPPLLFWINRDSCMAGGVVLFPEDNDAQVMETGHYCAQALGLRYFVTWTRSAISFWDDETPPRLRKQLALGAAGKPTTRDFQEALQQLLEEVKLLSVLAAVPPPNLSACYLANLWRTTLQRTTPLLDEDHRIARSEQRLPPDERPETLAIRKSYLTFFRLLALSFYDLLPAEIQPRQLETEMIRALPALPCHLQSALISSEAELPLPEEVAVIYHLLLRRLTQLRPASDLLRCCQALALLLTHAHDRLGGHALPFGPPSSTGTLLVNPDRAYAPPPPALEFAPPALLAGLALQRHLCDQPAIEQSASLWQAPESFVPRYISGTLNDLRQLSPEGRNHYSILLRRSWPNRRFALSATTPTWAWQLLHLLGLAGPEATLELRLPKGWLSSPQGLVVLELIQKQFTLEHLCDQGDAGIILRIEKTEGDERMTTLVHARSSRCLAWGWLNSRHPALLPLALYLPEPLFQLLQKDLLCVSSDPSWPDAVSEAVFAYTRSLLGQAFWQLLGEGRALPRRALLQREIRRTGLPLPPARILEHVQQAMNGATSESMRQRACDKELAHWLGAELADLTGGLPAEGHSGRPAEAAPKDPGELVATISREVFVDGLPLFPEHYLYDYYRPELRSYTFTPPLNRGPEFFGRVELIDGQQRTLEVDSPDAVRALLLIAASGHKSARLPVDPQITAAIVQRYLTDLQELHHELARCCHRHCTDSTQAETLAETVWAGQPLPDWKAILEASET